MVAEMAEKTATESPFIIRHLGEKACLAEIQCPYINVNSYYSNFLYCYSHEIQQQNNKDVPTVPYWDNLLQPEK